MEVHGYARTTLGRARCGSDVDGGRLLVTPVSESAVGNLRFGGDDAWDARYEWQAIHAEHARR
jgi:hypothetical protein